MEVLMKEMWEQAMVEAFRETGRRLTLFLPKLLALVTFLALGLVAGWVVKLLVMRLLKAVRFDKLGERLGLKPALSRAGLSRRPSELIGRLSFWLVFLIFALMGIDALDLQATTNLIGLILGFLPHVLASVLLLLFGLLLANFLAEAALIAAVNAQIQEARLIANMVRWGILLITAAMLFTQLGIAKEIVIAAFCIIFGGIVMALAIALGLGGRHIAREGLERRLRKKKRDEDEMTHV
jgi:hypothetical protein